MLKISNLTLTVFKRKSTLKYCLKKEHLVGTMILFVKTKTETFPYSCLLVGVRTSSPPLYTVYIQQQLTRSLSWFNSPFNREFDPTVSLNQELSSTVSLIRRLVQLSLLSEV